MFRLAVKYISYKLFAKHRKGHGIHSPFVYSFVRNVLCQKEEDENLRKILKWHSIVKDSILPVQNDQYGARSRAFKLRKGMKASAIGITRKFGIMLYRLVLFATPARVIELGTGSGISTAYIAGADPGIPVTTIEGSKTRLQFAKDNISKLNLQNIEFINGDFDEALQELNINNEPVMVFIDGNHSYLATISYFHYLKQRVGEDSVFVFDDIRWSQEMERAWLAIKTDSAVSISIDLFFMGIVFFRKGITKQEFVVNF